MSIPIIFLHRGSPQYLHCAIKQAVVTNPEYKVFLITDTFPPDEIASLIDVINLGDFAESVRHFISRYVHIAHSEVAYERFCFTRWLIIREFLKRKGFSSFVHLDSDVLLFENIKKGMDRFALSDFTLSRGQAAHICFWRSLRVFESFCDYFLGFFNGTDERLIDEILSWFKQTLMSDYTDYGLSDMYFLNSFAQYSKAKVGETTDIIDGSTFNNNISFPAEVLPHFSEDPLTKLVNVYWRGSVPFAKRKDNGELVRLNLLHFQGNAKRYLPEFFLVSQYCGQSHPGELLEHSVACQILKSNFPEIFS